MQRIRVNDVELEYESAGSGEPVLLVHGAIVCDTFAPLLDRPTLEGHQRIRYRRRGYGGVGAGESAMTVEQHAADALALLEQLDVARCHVVGHSYGGLVALQMAGDAPDVVHSIALLETGVAGFLPTSSAMAIAEALAPVLEAYGRGDREHAIGLLCGVIFGPDYRELLEKNLPGSPFALAVSDAASTFEGDLGSMGAWALDPSARASITQPVLNIMGAETDALMKEQFGVALMAESAVILRDWLPQIDEVILPGLRHGLQAQDPLAVGAALTSFLNRNPIAP